MEVLIIEEEVQWLGKIYGFDYELSPDNFVTLRKEGYIFFTGLLLEARVWLLGYITGRTNMKVEINRKIREGIPLESII